MAAHHGAAHARYSLPPPPNPIPLSDFRLPSIKDLNFPYRSPLNPTDASNVPPSEGHTEHSARHGSSSWGRNPSTSAGSSMSQHPHHQPSHQQLPPLSGSSESQPPKNQDYTPKHDSGYIPPNVPSSSSHAPPMPNSVYVDTSPRMDNSTHKRARPPPSANVPRDTRQPHPYPPPQPYPYQSPGPYQAQTPQPPEPVHHHHSIGAPPAPPNYSGYAQQQYLPPHGHNPPPHAQAQYCQHPSHPHLSSSYPQPPPPLPPHDAREHRQQTHHQSQHLQQHPQPPNPPPPPPQHQQTSNSSRTTALVPTNVQPRMPPASFSPTMSDKSPARDNSMDEILRLCYALWSFANRYAQLQSDMTESPSTAELNEMTQRANEVVHRLEEYRRLYAENDRKSDGATSLDDHRGPKRPWEDGPEVQGGSPESSRRQQTTAEQDMEIIRSKRATTAAGGSSTAGQPKSKYRKRSRANPPGKCHSCNIRETPEWRRGPDGARTLCNACGLHYAKLQRKREKAQASGSAPPIDIATLRASTRATDSGEKGTSSRSSRQPPSSQHPYDGSAEQNKAVPPQQQHHQGSFQLVPVMSSPGSSDHRRGSDQQAAQPPVPPPPWATNSTSSSSPSRGYAPELPHQSFMRTSQQAPR